MASGMYGTILFAVMGDRTTQECDPPAVAVPAALPLFLYPRCGRHGVGVFL